MLLKKIISNNKSQITLFIIFAVIILVGFIFLLLSSSSQQIIEVEMQFTDSNRQEFNIYNLYEASESCLLLATRKAVLLISSRGGFIYPHEHSVEFDVRLNSFEFSDLYLTNLNLNPNLLQQYVYPGLSQDYYLMYINSSTIRSELEHYITRDFVRCQVQAFDSVQFSNLSYSVLDTSTITPELHSNSEPTGYYIYPIGDFKANTGEIINLYTSNGSIIESIYNLSSMTVKAPIRFNENEIVVGVLDETFSISVILENYRIVSTINTVDSFSGSSTFVDRGNIEASVNTPLFSLINDLRTILIAKSYNRSIDFRNQSHINRIHEEGGKISNFKIRVRDLEKNQEEVFQEIILTSLESRNFEFDSFVTLYRNTAPIIGNNRTNFEVVNSINPNFLHNELYLNNSIIHNEIHDTFTLIGREFEPYEDDTIKLYPNGTFELVVTSGPSFTYEFFLTDGELFTPFEVTFNLGGELNENNRDVGNCFEVTYHLGSLDQRYDQINRFIDNKTRGVNLQSVQVGSTYQWYGLVTAGQSGSVNVKVDPNPDCFDGDLPIIPDTLLSTGHTPQSISIENPVGEDFKLTIGAVDCLGPLPIGFDISNPDIKGSCCDIQKLQEQLQIMDFGDLVSTQFILPDETVAIKDDEELFVCVEGPRASQLSDWNNANFLKTQNLTTTLTVTCRGTSPILEENFIQTSGDIGIGEYTPLDYPSNTVDVKANHNNYLDVCRECRMLSNEDAYVLESSSGRLSIGFDLESDDPFNPPTKFAQEDLFLETSSFTDRILISGICYQRSYEYRCQLGQRVRVVANAIPITLLEGESCT